MVANFVAPLPLAQTDCLAGRPNWPPGIVTPPSQGSP